MSVLDDLLCSKYPSERGREIRKKEIEVEGLCNESHRQVTLTFGSVNERRKTSTRYHLDPFFINRYYSSDSLFWVLSGLGPPL